MQISQAPAFSPNVCIMSVCDFWSVEIRANILQLEILVKISLITVWVLISKLIGKCLRMTRLSLWGCWHLWWIRVSCMLPCCGSFVTLEVSLKFSFRLHLKAMQSVKLIDSSIWKRQHYRRVHWIWCQGLPLTTYSPDCNGDNLFGFYAVPSAKLKPTNFSVAKFPY